MRTTFFVILSTTFGVLIWYLKPLLIFIISVILFLFVLNLLIPIPQLNKFFKSIIKEQIILSTISVIVFLIGTYLLNGIFQDFGLGRFFLGLVFSVFGSGFLATLVMEDPEFKAGWDEAGEEIKSKRSGRKPYRLSEPNEDYGYDEEDSSSNLLREIAAKRRKHQRRADEIEADLKRRLDNFKEE